MRVGDMMFSMVAHGLSLLVSSSAWPGCARSGLAFPCETPEDSLPRLALWCIRDPRQQWFHLDLPNSRAER